jgi:hypothetical protein
VAAARTRQGSGPESLRLPVSFVSGPTCEPRSADDYLPCAQYSMQGHRVIYGLGLPDDVLEKIGHGSVERQFAQFQGGKWAVARGIAGSYVGKADG